MKKTLLLFTLFSFSHHVETVITRNHYSMIQTLSQESKNGNFGAIEEIINTNPALLMTPLDNSDNTIIHYVAKYGNLTLMQNILTKVGFHNNNLRNTKGLTPLDMAQSGLEELDDPTFTDPTCIVFEDKQKTYHQLCSITEVKRQYREIIKLLKQ